MAGQDQASKLRREHCHLVSGELVSAARKSDRHTVFYCRTSLEAIWTSTHIDAIFQGANKEQKKIIKANLLLFISFLIRVNIEPSWFADSESKLFFRHNAHELKFTDEDEPRTEKELLALDLTPQQGADWVRQYEFRPATIILDTEESEMHTVQEHHPLPFQIPDTGRVGKRFHGESWTSGSTSGHSGSGTVRVSRSQSW